MYTEKGYEVLKLVTRGERCYVSTDYIRGKPLMHWMKYHASIPKEQMYQWMREITGSLELFHRLRGNPCYQYVNPCSIIVSEEEKLYLLDLGSDSQRELLLQMQRRGIREHFVSPDNQYYQKASVEEDIYGLGKTLQYMLSVTDTVPSLSFGESAQLRKIISRCLNPNSKKKYQTIQEISEHFPKSRERIKIRKKYVVYGAVLLLMTALAAGVRGWGRSEEKTQTQAEQQAQARQQPKVEQVAEAKQKDEEEYTKEYIKLVYDTGLLYFLELNDYSSSRETFREIEKSDALAADYVKLCSYLVNPQKERNGRELEMLLGKMEEVFPDEADERYYFTLLKGYELSEAEESAKEKIRLCKLCLEKNPWKSEDTDRKREKWVKGLLASAYEQMEEYPSAVQQYEELLEMEEQPESRAGLYGELVRLHEKMGQVPGFLESEEFKTLQQEYGIGAETH